MLNLLRKETSFIDLNIDGTIILKWLLGQSCLKMLVECISSHLRITDKLPVFAEICMNPYSN